MPKPSIPLPSRELLLELFNLNVETGVLIWKVSPSQGVRIGAVAGCFNKVDKGRQVVVQGRLYKEHRLIYLMYYGVDPHPLEVDHKNGIRSDNRPCNLRLATRAENSRNLGVRSKSGVRGGSLEQGKIRVRIRKENKHINIGWFTNKEEAIAASKRCRSEVFGEFLGRDM